MKKLTSLGAGLGAVLLCFSATLAGEVEVDTINAETDIMELFVISDELSESGSDECAFYAAQMPMVRYMETLATTSETLSAPAIAEAVRVNNEAAEQACLLSI